MDPSLPERVPLPRYRSSRDLVAVIGDLLPVIDLATVLLAAWLAWLVCVVGLPLVAASPALLHDGWRAAFGAAVIAPLILCDRAFVVFASGGDGAALVRCHAVRFAIFLATATAIGYASPGLGELPGAWLLLWLATTLVLTAAVRGALFLGLRRYERDGSLAEAIALVGSGPGTDALIDRLLRSRGASVEIVGVFDDRAPRAAPDRHPRTGTIDDLTELGKSRPLDWVVMTLPESATARIQSILHRLMALSAPIGLSPGAPAQPDRIDAVVATTDRAEPGPRFGGADGSASVLLPPWIATLLGLPSAWLRRRREREVHLSAPPAEMASPLAFTVDDYDLDGFAAEAARFGTSRYGYAVTANVDHLLRLHRDPAFRAAYADAAYTLLDSRFLARLLSLTRRLTLRICTGSDLTARLFAGVLRKDDKVVLVGGSPTQAATLATRHGLRGLVHIDPPMGFIHDPDAVAACLAAIEAHSPFRFCLLAVGSPQQEFLAQRLKARGIARGMALCVGASINFLTGVERRAPAWMQRLGVEWLFRLLQAPRRLGARYLWHGPRVFALLGRTRVQVRATTPSAAERVMFGLDAPAARLQRPASAAGRLRRRTLHLNAPAATPETRPRIPA